jgi:hypothetical protein
MASAMTYLHGHVSYVERLVIIKTHIIQGKLCIIFHISYLHRNNNNNIQKLPTI